MTASPHQVFTEPRARSLALRLLGGAGSSAMHAYRLGLCATSLTHAIHDGRLLVACQPEDEWLLDFPLEVRLDFVLHTQQAEVAITAASAHLLGTLTWLPEEDAADLATKGLPGLLDAPLAVPGGRLGVVDVGRIVLHDFTGATAIDLPRELPAPAPFVDEWTAQELVAELTQEQLRDICWATLTGRVAGESDTRAVPGMCGHLVGRAFVVDVDPHGLTVMLTAAGEVITAFAAFETPAHTATDLGWSLARLAADSEPTRNPRI